MAQDQNHASEEIMAEKANGNLQQAANHGQCENPGGDLASEGPIYPTGLRLVFIFFSKIMNSLLVLCEWWRGCTIPSRGQPSHRQAATSFTPRCDSGRWFHWARTELAHIDGLFPVSRRVRFILQLQLINLHANGRPHRDKHLDSRGRSCPVSSR